LSEVRPNTIWREGKILGLRLNSRVHVCCKELELLQTHESTEKKDGENFSLVRKKCEMEMKFPRVKFGKIYALYSEDVERRKPAEFFLHFSFTSVPACLPRRGETSVEQTRAQISSPPPQKKR
jgi:hypothetical protein